MQNEFAATRAQVRELDRMAIEDYGVEGVILMENAGRACAGAAADMLGGADGKRIVVLCGRGNNGGDGFVVARHLTNWGARVDVLLLATTQEVLAAAKETALNFRVVRAMGIPVWEAGLADDPALLMPYLNESDLLVDGLLGTGVRGEVREPYRSVIEAVNRSGRPVLAIDVPSGLDCDTGRPLGAAVRADRTVTFVFTKIGYASPGAQAFTGQVQVAEISIPRAAIERKLNEWLSEDT